jgi:hypothetical protein
MSICPDCGSTKLSIKIQDIYEASIDDVHQIGFVALLDENLVWTEFVGNATYIYSLRKNYAIVPTLSFDFENKTVTDPITDISIQLGFDDV